jgi:hypothetical protein
MCQVCCHALLPCLIHAPHQQPALQQEWRSAIPEQAQEAALPENGGSPLATARSLRSCPLPCRHLPLTPSTAPILCLPRPPALHLRPTCAASANVHVLSSLPVHSAIANVDWRRLQGEVETLQRRAADCEPMLARARRRMLPG